MLKDTVHGENKRLQAYADCVHDADDSDFDPKRIIDLEKSIADQMSEP
jgi:hypothetical protein